MATVRTFSASRSIRQSGQPVDARETLAASEKTGERFYEVELYRLKGRLLLGLSADNHLRRNAVFGRPSTLLAIRRLSPWNCALR